MTAAQLRRRSAYAGAPRRGPVTRLLEDERWLALVLLLPTWCCSGCSSPIRSSRAWSCR